MVKIELTHLRPTKLHLYQGARMKISVLRFYGYIEDISTDISEKNIDKPKIDQNL